MKIKDIISRIDKSEENRDSWIDLCTFAENEFDILGVAFGTGNGLEDRLKSYWIQNHYCTDSIVGWRAYFLDDIFVAMSFQIGRKCSEDFEWESIESYKKVRDYLLSLIEDNIEFDQVSFIDMDSDNVDDTYSIQFSTQLLSHHKDKALLGEIPVTIIKTIPDKDKRIIIGTFQLKFRLITQHKLLI